MPFYIRKSIGVGPFRFNLSKSGVGVSVGVKGLRVGTGPKGHYVHAGAHGLYYRASLGQGGARTGAGGSPPVMVPVAAPPAQPQGGRHPQSFTEIDSGPVAAMRDARLDDVLDTINGARRRARLSVPFGLAGAAMVLCALLIPPGQLGLSNLPDEQVFGLMVGASSVLALGLMLLGVRLDEARRTAVLAYDLDGAAEAAYRRLVAGFDEMVSSAAVWHIGASERTAGAVGWKRNAGASRLVQRDRTRHGYALPPAVACNVTPPFIGVGRQTLYFMPDAVFVVDGRRVGAVPYEDLEVETGATRFVEEEALPKDARVVDRTWRHPNRDGGPDRRFRDNIQLPVALYDELMLRSRTGLNELLQVSRAGAAADFAAELRGRRATNPMAQRPRGAGPRP